MPCILACLTVRTVKPVWERPYIGFAKKNGLFACLNQPSAWTSKNQRMAVHFFHFCAKSNRVSSSQALGQMRFGLIDLAAARTTVCAVFT